jgi:hypothetical protein
MKSANADKKRTLVEDTKDSLSCHENNKRKKLTENAKSK